MSLHLTRNGRKNQISVIPFTVSEEEEESRMPPTSDEVNGGIV